MPERLSCFTDDQLRAEYAFQARQGYVGDMGRTAAAMKLLGDGSDDDQVEWLAAEIGRALEGVSDGRKEYSSLVLRAFDGLEHVDRREIRDQKAAVERAARQRL